MRIGPGRTSAATWTHSDCSTILLKSGIERAHCWTISQFTQKPRKGQLGTLHVKHNATTEISLSRSLFTACRQGSSCLIIAGYTPAPTFRQAPKTYSTGRRRILVV